MREVRDVGLVSERNYWVPPGIEPRPLPPSLKIPLRRFPIGPHNQWVVNWSNSTSSHLPTPPHGRRVNKAAVSTAGQEITNRALKKEKIESLILQLRAQDSPSSVIEVTRLYPSCNSCSVDVGWCGLWGGGGQATRAEKREMCNFKEEDTSCLPCSTCTWRTRVRVPAVPRTFYRLCLSTQCAPQWAHGWFICLRECSMGGGDPS